MGSSWPLLCSTALVLVLLCSASKDERIVEQREVTFDPEKKGMEDPFMQREVDWTELLDPMEFPVEQVIVTPPKVFDKLSEKDKPSFHPRSFDGPSPWDYPVQFPLARPTLDNLQAICLNGDRRPRYPNSYFPASGFGKQRRKANAVNKAESWFSTCCEGNQTWAREVTLCCAVQAWELSIKSFCLDDTSVKDRQEKCCTHARDMFNCFNKDSPNPNYEPTEEIPLPPLPSPDNFNFDPNTCQRSAMTPSSARGNQAKGKALSASQKIDINFPPGRPTADSIESLCHNQNLRPRYNVKCLPGQGYEWLARQAKTINRIERGFKECCKKKKDVLRCADQKWSEELNKFCPVKKGGKMGFHCCSGESADDRYNCFQNSSPDPHYNVTSANEEPSLDKICDTHKIIKKKFLVGFPLKGFVEQCCPLSGEEKTSCSMQKLEEVSGTLCSSRKNSVPAARRCCRMQSQATPQCISKIVMDAITKATKVLHQKKKKMCPIS